MNGRVKAKQKFSKSEDNEEVRECVPCKENYFAFLPSTKGAIRASLPT